MAERAVLQFEVLELLMKALVLADLTSVVVLLQDAHSTGNTRRVVRTTILTVDIVLTDASTTLRTLGLNLVLVMRWVFGKHVDCQ